MGEGTGKHMTDQWDLRYVRIASTDLKQTYMIDRYQRGAYTDPYKNP
jgi:hypothetical protein